MIQKFNRLILASAIFVALASCNNSGKAKAQQSDSADVKKAEKPTEFKDNSFNKAARYIAGMPQLSQNEYSEWEKKPEWIAYKNQMDSTWDYLEKSRFSVMDKFYKENFGDYMGSDANVYYPFAGPDFLNIYQLYNHSSSYLLAGLEPINAIPTPMSMNEADIKHDFPAFYHGFRTLKTWGYYVTSYMGKDLNLRRLKGVIPIYYAFMVRMGCSIEKVELLSLDPSGKATVVDGLPNDKINMKGCRVTFRHPDGKVSTLTYFEGNLADGDSEAYGHTFIQNYQNYVKANSNNANSYLKAASYLLYDPNFTKSLYLLLDVSKTILTDESGVPYDMIDRSKWDVKLYGKYFPPTKDFKWIKQPALKADYMKDSSNVKSIPFFTGYHRNMGESNLQFYIKK
jgi:hypothetical protein